MEWHAVVGILAGIIQAISAVPYIWSILQGETRPNLVSYALWALLGYIEIAAQISAGPSWSLAILLVVTFNVTITTILILFGYGYKKYTWIDGICFIFALLAIVLWQVTNNPVVALVLSTLANTIVVIPTILKIKRDPYSEHVLGWFLVIVAAALSIVAAKKDVANLILPIDFLLEATVITALAFFGQRSKRARMSA